MTNREEILAFEPFADPPGVEIIDAVERLRYRLRTSEPVSPTPAGTDGFLFPVDRAIRMTTEELVLPNVVGVCVRDQSGEMIAEVGHLDAESVDEGTYILELSAQIKTYVVVEGPIEVTSDLVEVQIDFGGPRDMKIGAVSWHDRPAATVTTTHDPVDMMDAISTFGSALKTTSPERSFPSNRGHPPAVRLGDELDVPATVQPPETGVRLEIPAAYDAVYTAAPLAYYLGAEVVPGAPPRLVTDEGFEHALDAPNGLEEGVERTLKQLFVLDCVTRTEGVYEIGLRERNEIERYLDFDWASLYGRPLAEQVATYLEVPYTLLEDHVPEWRLTVHVEPVSPTVEQVPFVVDDLAVVRSAETHRTSQMASLGETGTLTRDGGVLTRSAAESSNPDDISYVEPESSGSLEQAWIGDSIPIGASKLTPDAFQNRLDRDAVDGDISISIVLNDPRMSEEEDLVNRAYGDRENLPFDVSVHRNLTVAGLREQLGRENSFLHYIGHTEEDGFECADGKLDAATLEETGVDAFLLNACNSYRQGIRLIEAGAIGGIVTLNDIINDGAVRIGETVARLLNAGFPLRAVLTIARDESVLGGQYIVVGDGGMTVTQSSSRTPNLLEISSGRDGFSIDIHTFATDDAGLGTVYKPHLSDNEEYFLSSGKIATFQVSSQELLNFLQLEEVPVRDGDRLRWSSELSPDELE
jgi:hypothetical protein